MGELQYDLIYQLDMLDEKLQIFQDDEAVSETIPSNVYRVYRIELDDIDCSILRTKDFKDTIDSGPLTNPTKKRPIANIRNNTLYVSNGTGIVNDAHVFYFRRPNPVEWGYFIINDKALYDSSNTKTTHFELHASEESELVYRILAFAGITLQKPALTQTASVMEQTKVQQEKQ